MISEPGVYDISLDEYLADPVIEPSLNSHVANALLTRSPRHAKAIHPRLAPGSVPDVNAAMELGTLAHRIVLEGCPGDVVVIEARDFRTKAAQAQREAARDAGKIPMLEAQWIAVDTMVTAWREQFRAFDPVPFQGGRPEATLVWREDDRIWCRARPDYVQPGFAFDLKTTSTSAEPSEWSRRRLWDAGHDLQMAFQGLGLARVTGQRHEIALIVCEIQAPYGVAAISLDPESWEYASQRMVEAMRQWADCLATGRWPGYRAQTAYAELPPWIKAQWAERAYWRTA